MNQELNQNEDGALSKEIATSVYLNRDAMFAMKSVLSRFEDIAGDTGVDLEDLSSELEILGAVFEGMREIGFGKGEVRFFNGGFKTKFLQLLKALGTKISTVGGEKVPEILQKLNAIESAFSRIDPQSAIVDSRGRNEILRIAAGVLAGVALVVSLDRSGVIGKVADKGTRTTPVEVVLDENYKSNLEEREAVKLVEKKPEIKKVEDEVKDSDEVVGKGVRGSYEGRLPPPDLVKLESFKRWAKDLYGVGKIPYLEYFLRGEEVYWNFDEAQMKKVSDKMAEFGKHPDKLRDMDVISFLDSVSNFVTSPATNADSRNRDPRLVSLLNDDQNVGNCVARTKATIALVQKHRPELMKDIRVQMFENHYRAVAIVDGVLYSLDTSLEAVRDYDIYGTYFIKAEDAFVKPLLKVPFVERDARKETARVLRVLKKDTFLMDIPTEAKPFVHSEKGFADFTKLPFSPVSSYGVNGSSSLVAFRGKGVGYGYRGEDVFYDSVETSLSLGQLGGVDFSDRGGDDTFYTPGLVSSREGISNGKVVDKAEMVRILAGLDSDGIVLHLNGIKEFGPGATEELAKWIEGRGKGLHSVFLNGLERSVPSDVEGLASLLKSKRINHLYLNGLHDFPLKEVMVANEAMPAEQKGWNTVALHLDGVKHFSDKTLVGLRGSGLKLSFLSLGGMKNPGIEDGKAIVSLISGRLLLNGLEEINDDFARAFGVSRYGMRAEMNGLKSLSVSAASILGKSVSNFEMNGIRVFPPEVAKGFVGYKGCLFLEGVDYLPVELAKVMSEYTLDIFRFGVNSFEDGALDALSGIKVQQEVEFARVSSISAENVRAFAKFSNVGSLSFPGVGEIDPGVADIFASSSVEVYFGLTAGLSSDVVGAIVRAGGRIRMPSNHPQYQTIQHEIRKRNTKRR
jgi:hypothetical protein